MTARISKIVLIKIEIKYNTRKKENISQTNEKKCDS